MRFFVSSTRTGKKPASNLALAIALATGTALLSGVVAEPAFAQREKKEKKKAEAAAYSKEFVAMFQPLQAAVNTEGGDIATAKTQFPALLALTVSPDEKNAAGGLIYNAGAKTGDQTLQLQGMKLMLESGKVAPEQVGRFNFIAYQLSNAQRQFAESRVFLQNAIDTQFTTADLSVADMQTAMAESFISEQRYADGLNYLAQAIANAKADGQKVEETWYRRGLSVGYNNQVTPQVYEFVTGWVIDYPSATNWRDAINIARNMNSFDGPEMLDLLRLSLRVGALQEKYEYRDYVEAADARRLPKEVKTVIDDAFNSGRASRDDIYLADALQIANGRIAADERELPSLASDARAANAGLRTVVAAGDTFLSYSQYPKAEEFYAKALSMAGVNAAEVQTRLGIAQTEQGKYDEAIATFGKIGGKRDPIARLWAAYAIQKKNASTPPVQPEAAPGA